MSRTYLLTVRLFAAVPRFLLFATDHPDRHSELDEMLDHLVAVLLPASALMLVLEGIPYFASPSMAKKFLGFVASRPEWMVRAFGLFLMCAGLAFLWATRQG